MTLSAMLVAVAASFVDLLPESITTFWQITDIHKSLAGNCIGAWAEL